MRRLACAGGAEGAGTSLTQILAPVGSPTGAAAVLARCLSTFIGLLRAGVIQMDGELRTLRASHDELRADRDDYKRR